MKKLQFNLKSFLLIGILIAFITYSGCNNDDKNVDNSKLLIGLWTIDDVNLVASIGGQSLKDYFINVGGLSEAEADIYTTLFESFLSASFTGTIQFKDNNTYISNIAGDPDEGTWSLNSTGDKITMDPGTPDETVIDIVSLTANMLIGNLDTKEFADVDQDPDTPDVEILLSIEMTLIK